MIDYWDFYTYGYDATPAYGGCCVTTLPIDRPDDTIDRLRAVVEEVTGRPLEKEQPRRMGFL